MADKRFVITRYLAGNPTQLHNVAKGYNPGNFIRNLITGELFYTKANGVHINLTQQNTNFDIPVILVDFVQSTIPIAISEDDWWFNTQNYTYYQANSILQWVVKTDYDNDKPAFLKTQKKLYFLDYNKIANQLTDFTPYAPLENPEFIGTIKLNGIDIPTGELSGTNYVMVYGVGTPQENAAELQAAYDAAKKMPRYLGAVDDSIIYNFYKGQTLLVGLEGSTYGRFLVDFTGALYDTTEADLEIITEQEAKPTRTTVIVAPGDYGNPTITEVSGIDIRSLTGKSDVLINGVGKYGMDKGTNYIRVYGTGTPEENAAELQAAYNEAKKMPRYLGILSSSTPIQMYKGQTFGIFTGSYLYYKILVDGAYNPFSLPINLKISESEAKSVRTTVIVAPGKYNFGASAFIANATGINIVSLTGNSDVIISSTEESLNYGYYYGIKVTANNVLVKGIDCKTNDFYIANDLNNLICEYCTGGRSSFGAGGVTVSGTFNNCIGGDSSFGSDGGTLTGTLINCKLTSGTFTTPTGTGKIYNCIDGNGNLINSEPVIIPVGTESTHAVNKAQLDEKVQKPTYGIYSGIFSQSGTEAPTWQHVETTIGDIVWTRDSSSVGRYIGTLSGAFVDKQIFCLQNGIKIYGNANEGTYITIYKEVDNTLILETTDSVGDTSDGLFPTGVFVEIRIY